MRKEETMTKNSMEKKELIEKYEKYSCGCSKSFRVNGYRIDGFSFLCYDHGLGSMISQKKRKQ